MMDAYKRNFLTSDWCHQCSVELGHGRIFFVIFNSYKKINVAGDQIMLRDYIGGVVVVYK